MIQYIVSSTDELFHRIRRDQYADLARDGRDLIFNHPVRITLVDTAKSVAVHETNVALKSIEAMMDWYCASPPHGGLAAQAALYMPVGRVDVNSPMKNLGYAALGKDKTGESQLTKCVQELRSGSREATIDYCKLPQGQIDEWSPGVRTQMFRLLEGSLTSVAVISKADLIHDLFFDIPWLGSMQARVAEELGHVQLGNLIVIVVDAYIPEEERT